MDMQSIPFSATIPLLGFGAATLLLGFFFCCYLCRLKKQARDERGYRQVIFHRGRQISNSDICPVCLDEYHTKEQIALCRCGHTFHKKCLVMWLDQKNNCPVCKATVQQCRFDEGSGLVHSAVSHV
ncbi:RING finger protein 24-like [Tubulanus polymorphus]|uniref:RING finger protein 24-like n=1 Tax=Tubulanus polymorphus TaxID=672921 RepID=UPI003DA1EEBD